VVAWGQSPPQIELEALRNNRATLIALSGLLRYASYAGYYVWRNSRTVHDELERATLHIVGSPWSVQKLCELWPHPERAGHLPYPIDLAVFHPATQELERPPERSIELLWLGRITPRKRLDLMVAAYLLALEREPKLFLRVIGRSAYAHEYMRLLDRVPRDRVEYLPSLPRDQVPDLLRRTDVLVQPSEYENFGSSVAEALACGASAVVGPTNGTEAYLGDAAFRFHDYTPEALCEALLAAARAIQAHGARLRAEARAVAEREFAPSHVVAGLESYLLRARELHQARQPRQGLT
jgi:glycosyltransferase involved in cell wall biosynthesis